MTNFNQFLNKELNEPQRNAVIFESGPAIVIAGAGSGKTRVITTRIANLILNNNVSPQAIVALTFTNKAANEMKERISKFLDKNLKLPYVGTFHSYCLLLLRSNPTLLNFTNFSIIDADDQKSLIKKIIKKYGLEKQFSPTDILYQISNYKNKVNYDFDEFTIPIVKEIYLEYESEKQKSHSFDFDDLLLEILKIFKTNLNFRKNFQNKIRHLLVDEYQDTNMVQHELLKLMSTNENNKFNIDSLCAVGDEDQSIYSWRGAMATNMQNFQRDFAPVKLIKIEQNYRTVTPILEAANHIILNNKNRTNKKLWSEKKASNRILSIVSRSGKQEAYAITNFIENLPKEKSLNE
ncbi:UvrD-helicase domain-containing protein, partial [Candidatus Dependentiae bacterium]|nr:UvrD-helicase domain-containing protein [Candidatus Dependentiae bacterium]